MNVFVTGGTGVLGRPVVEALTRSGNRVVALSRREANTSLLKKLGATPVGADLFSVDQLRYHLDGCDTVLHLATRIPKTTEIKKRDAWFINDRIREIGTEALVDAALEVRTVKTFIYPSVTFVYADSGARWEHMDTAVLDPIRPLQSTLTAERHVARFAEADQNHRSIVLRFGGFYGPTSRESLDILAMAKKGFVMPLAPLQAYRSLIWIDDAAAAVIAAIRAAPGGIYDVAETAPFTQAEAINALTHAVGKRHLLKLPRWLLRFALSPDLRDLLARSQRIRSSKFCRATNWQPKVPDQKIGWHKIATQGTKPS